MYDRLSLDMIDETDSEDICLGRCILLAGKREQMLGLILEETDGYFKVGYPSRCYAGDDEQGNLTYEVVPYTRLPYLLVPKTSCSVIVPLHVESEFHFYSYIINEISANPDFIALLELHGFNPEACTEHYLQRYFALEPYCDTVELEEEIVNSSETIH